MTGMLYVDPVHGDDANPGTFERPKRTMGAALGIARAEPPSAHHVTLTPAQHEQLVLEAQKWDKAYQSAIKQREAARSHPAHWARIGGDRQMAHDQARLALWRGILKALGPLSSRTPEIGLE